MKITQRSGTIEIVAETYRLTYADTRPHFVTVTFADATATAVADDEWRWRVDLPPQRAGGPHVLVVRGTNEVRFEDVLVGEVWLCSGQSNMEMGLGVVDGGAEEAATANHPTLRLFELPQVPAGEPRRDIDAHWRVCTPASVVEGRWGGFSAVGYFFGRELQQCLDVPIGLIDSSWGGTAIAPWTSREGFELVDSQRPLADQVEEQSRQYRRDLVQRLAEIGAWSEGVRVALAAGDPLPLDPAWPRHPLQSHTAPCGLYHGMIHPLVPFALRGVIWYQGESNVHTHDGMAYRDKMEALIGGWRHAWGRNDLPFYYVQIAPFPYDGHQPGISPEEVPRLQAAQTAALDLPHTGMIVTSDISNLRDIHPGNKREVGRRLALWARARTYGEEGIVVSGPLFEAAEVGKDEIRIRFRFADGGLASRDGAPLNWFQIAGLDQRFVDAEGRIDGDTVVVKSDEVPGPVAVRFGWHQIAEPNLINGAGLPASPFRTDDWPRPQDEPRDE